MWYRFKSIYFYVFSGLLLLLYLVLRLGWMDTIEFGYDQPRLGLVLHDYIEHGSYLTSQSYTLESPWGNYSWGPALIYFYLPLFYISSNPLVVSALTAIINMSSIVVMLYIGKKYFSPLAGLFAGLFLATHPWWEIFSRMVYQPTPVPTFISFSILVTFLFLEKPSTKLVSLLLLLWGVLFQLYISCLHFILPSVVISLAQIKKDISKTYLGFGITLLTVLFIPSLYYYSSNISMFNAFFSATQKFEAKDKPFYFQFLDVARTYIDVIPGGGFQWQLGYANDVFHSQIFLNTPVKLFISSLLYVVLIYSIIVLFHKNTSRRLFRLLLLLWAVGPLWFMTFVKVPIIVPRYFILALPSIALLFGICINDCYHLLLQRSWKTSAYSLLMIPILISSWWVIYIVRYFSFIEHYDYPLGALSNFSDIPYVFLDNAMKWAQSDSIAKGGTSYVISTDIEKPTVQALNTAAHYYWENVLKREIETAKGDSVKYYMIQSTSEPQLSPGTSARFGPYLVYEYIKK